MRLYLLKTARIIRPATENDEAKLRRIPVGDLLPVHIRKPRNAGLHRKFFALVKLISENSPRYDSLEAAILELKIRAGHYREHITLDGEVVFLPKSIAYEEMEQADFEIFFERCVEIACSELIPYIPRDKLEHYLAQAAEF